MSNMTKSIRKNITAKRNKAVYELYGSPIGSIVVSIGKLVGKTEDEMLRDYKDLQLDTELSKCKTIREVCDFIGKKYNLPKEYYNSLVLVSDNRNFFTPIVTIAVEDNILPLNKDGVCFGILANLDKDFCEVEYIYEE